MTQEKLCDICGKKPRVKDKALCVECLADYMRNADWMFTRQEEKEWRKKKEEGEDVSKK